MTKFIVRGTVYTDYLVEVEAADKDEARAIAETYQLIEWHSDGGSGLDIYDVYEEDSDD